jgi:hypothetical protein
MHSATHCEFYFKGFLFGFANEDFVAVEHNVSTDEWRLITGYRAVTFPSPEALDGYLDVHLGAGPNGQGRSEPTLGHLRTIRACIDEFGQAV